MANGIQTLEGSRQRPDSAITKTLESMQSTLRQARQDKSFQTESLTRWTRSTSNSDHPWQADPVGRRTSAEPDLGRPDQDRLGRQPPIMAAKYEASGNRCSGGSFAGDVTERRFG